MVQPAKRTIEEEDIACFLAHRKPGSMSHSGTPTDMKIGTGSGDGKLA